jgi:hypothetical protein
MKKYILIFVTSLLLCSCATQQFTRASLYPKMYEEKPTSILIMPPINNTNHAEAKDYFYSSLSMPLTEKGYYVVSPFLASDLLKQESAYDSEMFINGSLAPFRNVFGADAVLFTTINRWEKQSGLSYIKVGIEYTLKSTKTGEVLFNRNGELEVNFSSGSNSLLGMVVDMISTAAADKIIAARRCNLYVLQDLPEGLYGKEFDKDQNVKAGKQEFKGKVKK